VSGCANATYNFTEQKRETVPGNQSYYMPTERREQVNDFLNEALKILRNLEDAKQNAISDRTQKNLAISKVAHISNLLRMSLDYLTRDIFNSVLLIRIRNRTSKTKNKANHRIYFPYGLSSEDFSRSVDKNLNGLHAANLKIYEALKEAQDFSMHGNILGKFCQIHNRIKHDNSVQIRKNKNIVHVGHPSLLKVSDCSNINFKGIVINNKRVDLAIGDSNDETTVSTNTPEEVFIETVDANFYFPEFEVDVVAFLTESHAQVENLTRKVYSLL
jgi:hypothetical protein